MHGDVNVRSNVAEVVAWLSHTLPGFAIVASSETPSGWPRNLTCFRAVKRRELARILWISDRALEDGAPGELRSRLDASGLGLVLQRDPSLQVLVRCDGEILLQEDHSIELDLHCYRVIRRHDHQVSIIDDQGIALTPDPYYTMKVSVHSKSDDQWRIEIRKWRKTVARKD